MLPAAAAGSCPAHPLLLLLRCWRKDDGWRRRGCGGGGGGGYASRSSLEPRRSRWPAGRIFLGGRHPLERRHVSPVRPLVEAVRPNDFVVCSLLHQMGAPSSRAPNLRAEAAPREDKPVARRGIASLRGERGGRKMKVWAQDDERTTKRGVKRFVGTLHCRYALRTTPTDPFSQRQSGRSRRHPVKRTAHMRKPQCENNENLNNRRRALLRRSPRSDTFAWSTPSAPPRAPGKYHGVTGGARLRRIPVAILF